MLSESEGFPTVFTEGMALGKPFISSAVGGTQELSNNGSCGVIINDYNDFKQAVSDIIFNPDNYEKIVIAMECDLPQDQEGIKIIGAVDFLLSE